MTNHDRSDRANFIIDTAFFAVFAVALTTLGNLFALALEDFHDRHGKLPAFLPGIDLATRERVLDNLADQHAASQRDEVAVGLTCAHCDGEGCSHCLH